MICGSYKVAQTGIKTPFLKGQRRGMVDGIEVLEFDLSYSNHHGFLRRTLTFISFSLRSTFVALFEPADIVFATSTPLTAGIPGIAARWLRGRPFVFEVRDLWPELPRAMGVITNRLILGLMEVLEWLSYKSADRLIALSPGILDGIARHRVNRDRIAFISNGCDIDLFSQPAARWRPAQVGATDLMAVFSGTHGPANGLDAVLDAAAELRKRKRSDIKIVLVGEGKQKPELQKRAAAKNLDNVIFLNSIDKRSLASLLADADLGLQILADVPAFYYGTSPNKFFDYLASGIPVLTNYPGWVAEMIVRERIGYAVPPRDPGAFADALEQAAEERSSLPSLGMRARALADREFSRQKLGRKFVQWLEGVMI